VICQSIVDAYDVRIPLLHSDPLFPSSSPNTGGFGAFFGSGYHFKTLINVLCFQIKQYIDLSLMISTILLFRLLSTAEVWRRWSAKNELPFPALLSSAFQSGKPRQPVTRWRVLWRLISKLRSRFPYVVLFKVFIRTNWHCALKTIC